MLDRPTLYEVYSDHMDYFKETLQIALREHNDLETIMRNEHPNNSFQSISYVAFRLFRETEQVFFVKKKLFNMLYDTKIPEEYEMLKLPYDAFCIMHPFGITRKYGYRLYYDSTYLWKVDGGFAMVTFYADKDSYFRKPGIDDIKTSYDYFCIYKESYEDVEKKIQEESLYHIRMILNMLAYINCDGISLIERQPEKRRKTLEQMKKHNGKNNKKRNHLRKKIDNYTRYTQIVLGSELDDLEYETETPSTKTGRRLDKRFLVRGHFRRYKSSRYSADVREATAVKPQWIRPYWKGPDMAEKIKRKYVVG